MMLALPSIAWKWESFPLTRLPCWLLAAHALLPIHGGAYPCAQAPDACLGFSAFFELVEWWSALAFGADADAFLATQGDPWDTQWDMFTCLCGAIAALLLLSRLHDRQLGPALLAGK